MGMVSFKGNHKKSGFLMPRHSRKRGKEIKNLFINKWVCSELGLFGEF
ncbi:MAG: hypothetical protein ACJAX4_002184 [Clostridium sp.]|jgi:hypothetical protein